MKILYNQLKKHLVRIRPLRLILTLPSSIFLVRSINYHPQSKLLHILLNPNQQWALCISNQILLPVFNNQLLKLLHRRPILLPIPQTHPHKILQLLAISNTRLVWHFPRQKSALSRAYCDIGVWRAVNEPSALGAVGVVVKGCTVMFGKVHEHVPHDLTDTEDVGLGCQFLAVCEADVVFEHFLFNVSFMPVRGLINRAVDMHTRTGGYRLPFGHFFVLGEEPRL
jgi:hypothetical protein